MVAGPAPSPTTASRESRSRCHGPDPNRSHDRRRANTGRSPIDGEFELVKIRDVMNTKAARIHLGQPMALAAETLVLTQAGDLMVLDEDDAFVGVLAGGDLLHAIMPDFEGLMEAGASLQRACEIFVAAGDVYADEPIDRLVIHGSITVSGDDELLKAATVMITMGIRLLAV